VYQAIVGIAAIQYYLSDMEEQSTEFEQYVASYLEGVEPVFSFEGEEGARATKEALDWWGVDDLGVFQDIKNRGTRRKVSAAGSDSRLIRYMTVAGLYWSAINENEIEDTLGVRKWIEDNKQQDYNDDTDISTPLAKHLSGLTDITLSAVSLFRVVRTNYAHNLLAYLHEAPACTRYKFIKRYVKPPSSTEVSTIGGRRLLRATIELTEGGVFLDGLEAGLDGGEYDEYVAKDVLLSADVPRPILEQLSYIQAVFDHLDQTRDAERLQAAMVASYDKMPASARNEIVAARLALKHVFVAGRLQDKAFLTKRDMTTDAKDMADVIREYERLQLLEARLAPKRSVFSKRKDQRSVSRPRPKKKQVQAAEPAVGDIVGEAETEAEAFSVSQRMYDSDETVETYLKSEIASRNIAGFEEMVQAALIHVAKMYGTVDRNSGIKKLRDAEIYEFKAGTSADFVHKNSWLRDYRVMVRIDSDVRQVKLLGVVPRKELDTWLRNNIRR